MNESTKSDATVTQLQAIVERDKSALARAIHDELGGYLIASAMDVTNLRHKFAGRDDETRSKFDRLSKMLNGAIDMMRRITEDLHPTLLDNVGLFAALRWQIKHMGHRSSVVCVTNLPDTEPLLDHLAAITLYRAGQEALIVAENHPGVRNVDFTVQTDNDNIFMRVSADGSIGPRPECGSTDNALGFLSHRINALGGTVSMTYPMEGGLHLSAQVPLASAMAFT